RTSRTLRSLPVMLGALLAADVVAQTDGADPTAGAETTDEARPTGPLTDDPGQLPELPELPALQGAETDAPQPPTDAPPPVTRLETLPEIKRIADDGQHEDAVPLLEQLIELTEEEFGAQSVEAADAYELAGRIQREAEDHQRSEQYYLH